MKTKLSEEDIKKSTFELCVLCSLFAETAKMRSLIALNRWEGFEVDVQEVNKHQRQKF